MPENLGTVYTVLDVEETLRRIRRESGLASHVHLTSQVLEASPRSAPGKRLVREYESAPLSQEGFRVHSVPIEVGEDTTYITLLLDEQDINQIVNSGFWVMTIGSLITLLVVLIAGYVLSRSFTRPILYLADVAQAVAAGDLSRRSHLPQQDEIGQLGRSLDHATDTITDLLEKQSILLDRQARMAGELQAILNSMGDGVLAVDVEERIVTINPTAATLLRQDVWHISGQQLDTIIATDEPLLAAGLHQIVEQIRSELADPVHPTTEERVSLGTRIVRIQSAPILAGGSILTGAVVLIQDITSAVEAERAKSEFIATASHELRTPLSGLKGFVDIFFLGGTDNLNESQYTFLTTIKRQTDNLVQMVNDLLEIARLEQGRVCAERRWVPIDRAIEESVTGLTTLIEKRQVALHVDVEPHLPCIWIDVLHLRRILTNILSNAVKYVHHGGTVQVRAYEVNEPPHLPGLASDQAWQHAEQRSVIVEIEDNGVGIRESDQPAIFSRFFRSENDLSVEVGGTGLGLAITKELVRTNQGQIGFRSVEGEGSCFWVRLPAPSTEPLQSNTSNHTPH
jgi:signal transduction histidine kinase/HAMP domain-containing protein